LKIATGDGKKALNPMVRSKLYFCAIASIYLLVPILSALVPASDARAQGQDGALIRKLAELTVRKGYKDFTAFAPLCSILGLPNDGHSCRMYHAPYDGKDGYSHSISVEKRRDAVHIFIVKINENNADAFLVGRDGVLLRFAFRTEARNTDGSRIWATKSIEDAGVKESYNSELAFWRVRLAELEAEPDRKD
jgi:hypothetical protein